MHFFKTAQLSRSLALSLALAGLTLTAPAAHAQTTAFSNFGPGNIFDHLNGWNEVGPSSFLALGFGGSISTGEGFTPSVSGSLSTITIALENYTNGGGTNDAHLFLAGDSGGVPGTILESFTLTNLPSSSAPSLDLITSASHPFLTAGTTYFLYDMEPGDENNQWFGSSPLVTGPHIVSFKGGAYTTSTAEQGAFSVAVNAPAVPEASTTFSFGLLLVLGMGGLIVAGKRRKA